MKLERTCNFSKASVAVVKTANRYFMSGAFEERSYWEHSECLSYSSPSPARLANRKPKRVRVMFLSLSHAEFTLGSEVNPWAATRS